VQVPLLLSELSRQAAAIWTQWLEHGTARAGAAPAGRAHHPKRLRAYYLYRRRLLGALAVGIVACLQTHGSRANWHPHLHRPVTDGGFRPEGTFVSWPAHDTARLTEAFRRAGLRLLVRLELFGEEQAVGMLDRAAQAMTYRSDKSDGPTAGTEPVGPLEFLARRWSLFPSPRSA
jgi:hypothetical protein